MLKTTFAGVSQRILWLIIFLLSLFFGEPPASNAILQWNAELNQCFLVVPSRSLMDLLSLLEKAPRHVLQRLCLAAGPRLSLAYRFIQIS